ncbi:MAG TPA: endonuclease III [Bacteroidota bacterium]|nr:endonuclease III [Bacteroidota bacterium]
MKENKEEKKERAKKIISILKKEYPEAKTKLIFKNPFQLLISTILSAQCTDDRVNEVTKELYKKYKTPEDFANAKIEELEKEIFSTGFYKEKAKKIKACSRSIIEKFQGNIPDNIDDLVKLEGIGRKTANVILGSAFGKPAIPVDTHVKRLSNLLKLAESSNPDKIEFELMYIIDKKNWTLFADLLMAHGRKICNAKKPKCNECTISDYCPSKKI